MDRVQDQSGKSIAGVWFEEGAWAGKVSLSEWYTELRGYEQDMNWCHYLCISIGGMRCQQRRWVCSFQCLYMQSTNKYIFKILEFLVNKIDILVGQNDLLQNIIFLLTYKSFWLVPRFPYLNILKSKIHLLENLRDCIKMSVFEFMPTTRQKICQWGQKNTLNLKRKQDFFSSYSIGRYFSCCKKKLTLFWSIF